jgi:hypothetical protein
MPLVFVGVLVAGACTAQGPVGLFDPTFQYYLRHDVGYGWVLVHNSDQSTVLVQPEYPTNDFNHWTTVPYWAPNGSRFAMFNYNIGLGYNSYRITFYDTATAQKIGDEYVIGACPSPPAGTHYFCLSSLDNILYWAPDGSSAWIVYPDDQSVVTFTL